MKIIIIEGATSNVLDKLLVKPGIASGKDMDPGPGQDWPFLKQLLAWQMLTIDFCANTKKSNKGKTHLPGI